MSILQPQARAWRVGVPLLQITDIPMVNEDGTFQYDDKGEIRMVKAKVMDRTDMESHGGKKWAVLNGYFKLVSKCPEQVLEYSWTDDDDKRRARAISKSHTHSAIRHEDSI